MIQLLTGLDEWSSAPVYAKTSAEFADRLAAP